MGCLALCGNISYQLPQGGGVPRPDIGWPGRNRGGHLPGGHLPGGRNARGAPLAYRPGGMRGAELPGSSPAAAARRRRATPRQGKLLRLMTRGS